MYPRTRRTFPIFAPGVSLRRRVAFSLAMVRLILAPVILLSVYYLFQMGWIMDRIVSVDAPAATLAQQASIQMLEARRSERNFFISHDPNDVKDNGDSLTDVKAILTQIRVLQPEEQGSIEGAVNALGLYEQRFSAAVTYLSQPGQGPNDRIQTVVRNYESDLNNTVRQNTRNTRAKLLDALRTQVNSFDTQITSTLQASDPKLRQIAGDLDISSRQVINVMSGLESGNWQRVQDDHQDARKLLHRAEWVLSIVSALTVIVSVWMSLVLPREVVQPLASLKEAVDHASAGNYEIEFEVQGKGEVVELAKSVRNLIAHVTAARQTV